MMYHTIWRYHKPLFCGTLDECKQYFKDNKWLIEGYSLEPQLDYDGFIMTQAYRLRWIGFMTEKYAFRPNETPMSMGRGI